MNLYRNIFLSYLISRKNSPKSIFYIKKTKKNKTLKNLIIDQVMLSASIIDILINIVLYLIPLIIFFGILGNMFAFIIFCRKKFENTVITIYFRILAITDTGTLIFAINRFLILVWGIRLRNYSHFLCVLIAYLFYIIPALSGWILVFISIDQHIQANPVSF